MNLLLFLAILLVIVFFSKMVAHRLHIPSVTIFVLLGMFLGPSFLGFISPHFLEETSLLNDLALGALAFSIGLEMKLGIFQKLGKSIFFIALFEAVLAFGLVWGGLSFFFPDQPAIPLLLGAVASATAPAATMFVLQQSKAQGPLTSTILAVVGIDDAIALIIFAFAESFARQLLGFGGASLWMGLALPFFEIGGSLLLGGAAAFLAGLMGRGSRNPEDTLILTALMLLGLLGLSELFHFSKILTGMAFGTILVNLNPLVGQRMKAVTQSLGPFFLTYFFLLAGARLNIGLLPAVGIPGLIFLVSRLTGKYAGATLGAYVGGASPTVTKYVGLGLFPQVGVAVALAIMVDQTFGQHFGPQGKVLSQIVINILLVTTAFTEIIGPLCTRWALKKAGEIPK